MKLTPEMRDLLAKASVVSEQRGARLDGPKLHSLKQSDMAPAGPSSSLADRMAATFAGCRTPDQARHAVASAKRELEAVKRTPQPQRGMCEVGSLAWKREIAGLVERARTGSEVKAIARVHGISRATAYNYRRQYSQRDAA